MICGICHASSVKFGEAILIEKHHVLYYRCPNCGFVQTEKPHWLAEAYAEALQVIDVGVIHRNLRASAITSAVISLLFPGGKNFVDYGGGHGTFVRLMRDRGFNFFWSDLYAKNLHARSFEYSTGTRYDLATAFEVLEHLPNPLEDAAPAFAMSDNLLTTTLLMPDPPPVPPNWWYYAVRGGQHVSFYTPASLQKFAEHFGRYVISSGGYHLFTCQPMNATKFRLACGERTSSLVNRLYRRKSLMGSDFEALSGTPLK